MPGVIVAIQTFGNRINLHPHLHFLVTEGGVDEAGLFHKVPRIDDSRLAEPKRRFLSFGNHLAVVQCGRRMKTIAFLFGRRYMLLNGGTGGKSSHNSALPAGSENQAQILFDAPAGGVPLEGKMGGDRHEVLVRFDEDEAAIDAISGDDQVAQR